MQVNKQSVFNLLSLNHIICNLFKWFNIFKLFLPENENDVIGGISFDTKHSWLAIGPYLQVFYTKSAKVRSVWCFGAVAKEPNAKIVCIQISLRP